MQNSRINTKIADVLRQCDRLVPAGVSFVSADPRTPVQCNESVSPFCRECIEASCSSLCRQVILANAQQGYLIGEPYYAPCWAGLNTVVFPVAPGGRFLGALEMGGFCYPEIKEDTLRFVRENVATLARAVRARLAPHTANFVVIPTMEVRGYSDFLYNALFAAGLNAVDDFRQRREKYLQQRRIADLMRRQGNAPPKAENVLEGLAALAAALTRRDRDQTMRLLDNLLSRILLVAADNPDKVRAHVLPLESLLIRARLLDSEADLDGASAIHVADLRELNRLSATEDICYWIFERVRAFLEGEPPPQIRGTGLGSRVATYLAENYARPVSLASAAKTLNASVSTIRRAIKAETGHTFHQHLVQLRIDEARDLLLTTDRTIGEIALDCGFYDAPHFSRLFKRETGLSPTDYRRTKHAIQSPAPTRRR